MANYVYGAIGLTGGGTGALDAIDGDDLQDNDSAIVFTASAAYMYQLDASSGAAESAPDVISPDANPGDKRWILLESLASGISLDTSSFDKFLSSSHDNLQALADALDDAFDNRDFDVSAGSIALVDEVVKNVNTDSTALIITSSAISIVGDGRISTDGSGSTLTISLDDLVLTSTNGNYTILASDDIVEGDCSSGNVQLTLPAASAKDMIRIYKKSSSYTLTIQRAGSDTIEGSTSISFTDEYQSITLVSNGSNTWIQF